MSETRSPYIVNAVPGIDAAAPAPAMPVITATDRKAAAMSELVDCLSELDIINQKIAILQDRLARIGDLIRRLPSEPQP